MTVEEHVYFPAYSGTRVDLLNIKPEMILLVDIIQSLSKTSRYLGHSMRPLYTAEHTVRLAHAAPIVMGITNIVDKLYWLNECLFHDAHEAYLGEIPRPIKHAGFMEGYRGVEDKVDTVVRKKFGLADKMAPRLKDLDKAICRVEINSGLFTPEFIEERQGMNFMDDHSISDAEAIAETFKGIPKFEHWGWDNSFCIIEMTELARKCGWLSNV